MISKFLRLSDRTLTSSSSEEMLRLGVGLSQGWCGPRKQRGRQGALQVTARPQPGGRTAPELRPGECTAGPGRCGTSRAGERDRAGREGGASVPKPLSFTARSSLPGSSPTPAPAPVLRPPALFPMLPLHPTQVLRLRMGVGGVGERRLLGGMILSRNRVMAPGWPGNTQVGILQLCVDRRWERPHPL